jgi:hypothetical protein
MTTKYAVARDRSFQWRAEMNKVKVENKALRRVYAEAKALIEKLPKDETTFDLRDAIRNAVFAE